MSTKSILYVSLLTAGSANIVRIYFVHILCRTGSQLNSDSFNHPKSTVSLDIVPIT